MASVYICGMAQQYPKPDRSDIKPNFSKTPENEAIDIAWQEGVLSDGRPYRAEYWCQDQISMVTFFLSAIGLENATNEDFNRLLETENLNKFKPGRSYVEARRFTDPSGNALWSINVMVGDDENTYVESGVPLNPYARS
jgi:hypothetical protein